MSGKNTLERRIETAGNKQFNYGMMPPPMKKMSYDTGLDGFEYRPRDYRPRI